MPELPDLELYKANLENKLVNKIVTDAIVINTKRLNINAQKFSETYKNKSLLSISRLGKELVFKFSSAPDFAVHLMLKGAFHVVEDYKNVKNSRIALKLNDSNYLLISDPQGFVTFTSNPPKDDIPDALSSAFTFEYFNSVLENNGRSTMKSILINQDYIKGIGNAYADEILYSAKIDPESTAKSLPDDVRVSIYNSINTVLIWAIDTLKNISPNAISGEDRSFLKVHRKDIERTETGYEIKIKKVASKKTYYTDEQILYK